MQLVKILTNEYSEKEDNPVWCLVNPHGDAPRSVCSGQVFGYGESSVEFESKETGRITCPECKKIIKWFKGIKL